MAKVCLIILDGFGIGINDPLHNAVKAAKTPFLNWLFQNYPSTRLLASGSAVGLDNDQFGNSEVGHLTIGAGRTISNLNRWLTEQLNHFQGDFSEPVNLIGIYSSGLVHGNKEHIDQLIRYFTNRKTQVILHLFADGRDTDKTVFQTDLTNLLSWIDSKYVRIGSVAGRFYAMDRDQNWERTDIAFQAIQGQQLTDLTPLAYVQQMYTAGYDDETLPPVSFCQTDLTRTNLFTNYRPDRIIQMIQRFQKANYPVYTLVDLPKVSTNNLFRFEREIRHPLDEVLFQNGISQLRIAETEKYAHVTYFFDGGKDAPNPLKETVLIPSNKLVSHASQPEMKAIEITDCLLEKADAYDFVLVNYANPDMLGHTGDFQATVRGIEIIDQQIHRIYNKIVKRSHCCLMITADHGNADQMWQNGVVLKTHTTALVPFLLTKRDAVFYSNTGKLEQIAPTILELMGLPKPSEMVAESLLIGEMCAKN